MPVNADNTCRTVSVPGTLHVLERMNPYEFKVRVDIMREGLNNNGWDYRHLDRYYKTFLGQPILIAYVGSKIGDGHNMREEIDADGGRVYTFIDGTSERIIGVLSEDENDFTLYERDGNMWVSAIGKIFTFYAREAVEKIIATGAMDVSAETDVYKSEDGPEGIEIFEEWAGLGVTILGDDVPPAIPGARIKQLAQIREDVNGLRLHAASLLKNSGQNNEPPKAKPRKGVKTTMNKHEMAQLQAKFDGYTVLSVSDDGLRVCLMRNEDCAFCGYTFADDGVVVPERIKAMRAVTTFAFDEDSEHNVVMDAAIPVDDLTAKLIRMNTEAGEKDKQISAYKEQVETMRRNERERRIEAAKAAVNQRFREMNSVREHCFDAKLAEEVCAMCDEGKFCEDVDKDGRWNGDKTAVNQLMAACMEAQAAMDKDAARKRGEAFNAWSYANGQKNDKPASNVEEMLAFLGK